MIPTPAPETITIPTTPPDSLLYSMAMRYNHAFGIRFPDEDILKWRASEYFDTQLHGSSVLTTRDREVIIGTMKQLYEEVAGKGFYSWTEPYTPSTPLV